MIISFINIHSLYIPLLYSFILYKAHVFAGRTCSEAKNRAKKHTIMKKINRSPLSLHININWFNYNIVLHEILWLNALRCIDSQIRVSRKKMHMTLLSVLQNGIQTHFSNVFLMLKRFVTVMSSPCVDFGYNL